jgi:hypothetical protein
MSMFPMLCALVSILLAVGGVSAQQDESYIYSNVEYNKEGGDLLGVELLLTHDGSHVRGQLKIYQGGCTDPIEVLGSLTGTRMDVSGKSDMFGDIELMGTLRDDTFAGRLRLGKAEKAKNVRLKKISKPHC